MFSMLSMFYDVFDAINNINLYPRISYKECAVFANVSKRGTGAVHWI